MSAEISVTQQNTSWEKYHQKSEIETTFASQLPYYEKMATRAQRGIDFTPLKTSYSVLGGFFPTHKNIESFDEFARYVNPRCKEAQIRYVDKNKESTRILEADEISRFQQADLSHIEQAFPPNSIDLLAMDYTTDFLQDNELIDLMNGLSHSLTLNGLVFMAKTDPLIPFLARIHSSIRNGVPTHDRSEGKFLSLVKPHLKVIDIGDYRTNAGYMSRIYTASRLDSDYRVVSDVAVKLDS